MGRENRKPIISFKNGLWNGVKSQITDRVTKIT